MRQLFILILIIAFLGSAYAFELGNQQNLEKTSGHVGQNPGTPDGRQGGEDMASAFPILAIPFYDTGNTTGHVDDYDEACPYTGSTSADVVYSFQPESNMVITVDLCGSGYDTKTYIYEGSGNLVYCNDDFYFDDICGVYVSMIEWAYIYGGETYYIVIDGYGGDAGDYVLDIYEFIVAPPCVLTCSGLSEGEPELMDGYEDAFNGGCNSPEFGDPFLDLTEAGNSNGDLVFCGISGWFNDNTSRDTDWMYIAFGELGLIEWTLDAEYPVYGFLLGGDCDGGITVDDQITAGACLPATMVLQGNPGDVIMIWVGPTEYGGPAGFVGHEFNYIGNFTGLYPGGCPAEKISIDHVKSLYR
jgi:hypothetical protein